MNNHKSKAVIAIIMVLLSIAIIIIGRDISLPKSCNTSTVVSPITKDGFYFDTYVSITVYNPKHEYLLSECMDICANYEKIFSRTDSESELYQLNEHIKASPEGSYNVSFVLYECIEKTLQYSEAFGEQYSILAGNICDLWDYEHKRIPGAEEIQNHLDALKGCKLLLANNSVSLYGIPNDKNIPSIDLGASAKGYIADKLCEHLKAGGVSDAIIDLGGNIVVIGNKYDDSMYKVGIKEPFSEESDISVMCIIANAALVTSGIYERYFMSDETIYHHIIDCQTGYPAKNDILSVTIIATNALQADCYSTGCLLMGKDNALSFINAQEAVECVIIDDEYNIYLSDGLTYKNDYIILK